jgi:hypothetical protein
VSTTSPKNNYLQINACQSVRHHCLKKACSICAVRQNLDTGVRLVRFHVQHLLALIKTNKFYQILGSKTVKNKKSILFPG